MKTFIAPQVISAMDQGQPVIALETTVITHGLAYPDNLECALAMEQAIISAGAYPATLGIVGGQATVGLSHDQIEQFARAAPNSIAKCSRRDLPVVMAAGLHGSLTVLGTMLVAHAANITIMATGGIGGVHQGHPFDISTDLLEMGRTPVAVVCAGIKSILDLPNTLEVLETQGVPVVGIGTRSLPAFFYRDSGLPLPASVSDTRQAAAIYSNWKAAGLGNGLLFTVPVPAADALNTDTAKAAIAAALAEADANGISGNAVTPWVLAAVARLTEGQSVIANKALLLNNARTAALIALEAAAAAPPY